MNDEKAYKGCAWALMGLIALSVALNVWLLTRGEVESSVVVEHDTLWRDTTIYKPVAVDSHKTGEVVYIKVPIVGGSGCPDVGGQDPGSDLPGHCPLTSQQRGLGGADIAQTLKQMVMPVPQTFVAQNGLVQEIEYALLTDHPWLQLSANPAWPWMFQNVKLEVSPNELKKPLKSGTHQKIDGIHALLDSLWLFDLSEGLIQL